MAAVQEPWEAQDARGSENSERTSCRSIYYTQHRRISAHGVASLGRERNPRAHAWPLHARCENWYLKSLNYAPECDGREKSLECERRAGDDSFYVCKPAAFLMWARQVASGFALCWPEAENVCSQIADRRHICHEHGINNGGGHG